MQDAEFKMQSAERSRVRQRFWILNFAFCILHFALTASTTPAQADRSAPRTDRNSQIAHEQLLQKARRGRIYVYFAGDSITR